MIVTTAARRTSKRANPDPVVLIRSSAYSSLPAPGNRVGPGDAANMPSIVSSSATGTPAILTATGAHHYRLFGLNIQAHASGSNTAIVKIGGSETALNQFPTDIVIDRCIVRGDDASATRRGVELDGIRCAVVDSYIYSILDSAADTQAIWAYNTPGPIKVVNNYLEASGENMMTGGADPSYANSVPSDIEIRRNYFKKGSFASWAASWSIKNLLEFKNAQRVLVEGNVFDTNYADSQNGYSLLITPRNQDGTATWCVTQDLTYRYNRLKNAEGGFNISGTDGEQTSQRTYRVSLLHNLIEIANQGSGSGILRCHGIISGPVDVQIINNTWVITSTGTSCGFHENTSPKADRTIWRNNVFAAGQYGILGTATGEGTSTFNGHFTNYEYNYNVMYGSSNTGSYGGTGNQFPAAATDVFTDFANGDYTVKAPYTGDGSDGNDPGVNWTDLQAAILHAEDGQWGSEPTTYTDSTYTNAELPRSYVNTIYETPTGGTEWIVTTAAEFTTALAGCAVGDIITLTAGNTFTGSFTLRNIT